MANATDQQVQNFSDSKIRPRSEQALSLLMAMTQDQAQIADVYNACNQGSPTWTDGRTDGPPHLGTPADVLSFNAFEYHMLAIMNGTSGDAAASMAAIVSAMATIRKLCVRSFG